MSCMERRQSAHATHLKTKEKNTKTINILYLGMTGTARLLHADDTIPEVGEKLDGEIIESSEFFCDYTEGNQKFEIYEIMTTKRGIYNFENDQYLTVYVAIPS